MSELTERIKQAFEEFDASYHKLRAHFLHALGADEKQLAQDTETAAKPLIAEAKQDAVNLVEEAVSGAPAKPADTTTATAAPAVNDPAADASSTTSA